VSSKTVKKWLEKGDDLIKRKKYEKALIAYEKAIVINPQHAEAWNGKGVALDDLKRHEDAFEAYEKAIEINPDFAEAWTNKGSALDDLKRHENALNAFEKAIEINSEYAAAWNGKGVGLCTLERYEEALTAYEKAIEKGPEDVRPYSNSGDLYFNLGDLKSASEKMEEALTNDITFAHALMLKGEIEIEKKDWDSASKSFEAAIRSDLGNLWPLLWNAYAKYLKAEFSLNINDKKYQEEIAAIIRELERANELFEKSGKNEDRANILYYLGYFYYKNKDIFTAKEKLKECVKLKSKSAIKPIARELLGYIWNYKISPPWWSWWLSSPLYRGLKIIVFGLLLSIPSLLLIHTLIPEYFHVIKVNWSIHKVLILIVLPIFFLFSPSIKSIKMKDFEVELLNTPPSFEPVLSTPKMVGKKNKNVRT